MATLHLISQLLSSMLHTKPKACASMNDIFDNAKHLWHQRNYVEAYRIFTELGGTYCYKSSICAWYRIQCLLALGHWHLAVMACLEQAKKESSEQWYMIASEVYMEQSDYTMAWEMLNRAPDSSRVTHIKRLAYEGAQCNHCIRRSDIFNTLPQGVIRDIFRCLDLPSLARCTRVSKRWRNCIISSPQLWSHLEFPKRTTHLTVSTIDAYLSRLGKMPLTWLSLQHQQTDGDGTLMALVQRNCCHLKTLIVSDMICAPALFFDALGYIGSALDTLHWGGVSLRLNDIIDNVPRLCTELKHLVVHDCFTSLYDAHLQNGIGYRLEGFGDTLPASYMSSIRSLDPMLHVESLELSGIHGLTASHLASIIVRCPNLKKLVLRRCLVNIIPVLNILHFSCPKLQSFEYERNRYCHQADLNLAPPLFDRTNAQRLEKRNEPYFYKPQYPWLELKIHLTNMLTDSIIENLLNGSRPSLKVLDLQGNASITDQCLLSGPPMKSLEYLCLQECVGITSKGLVALLAQSPLLEYIDLSSLSIVDDTVINQLAKCQRLKTLILSNSYLNVSEESFRHFIEQRKENLLKVRLDLTNIQKSLLSFTMVKLKKGIV